MKRNSRVLSFSGIKQINRSRLAPIIILFSLITAYVLFFSVISIDEHNRFHTKSFDLGIFDQAIWQYSRFSIPFNTVRGLNILGDHFTLINAIISPLYWFIDDVRALLVLQTLVLAAAAIPLYFIGKYFLKNQWIPLVFCFTYLLFPAIQHANFLDYHPEVFVPLFVLSSFYFIMRGHEWLYFLFFFLTLFVKEEIALTTFLMGIYIYFKHDKKIGILTSAFSLLWFILVIKGFIPLFNDAGFMYTDRGLGNFGNNPLEILLGFLNPKILFHVLFNHENAEYTWQLFSPVGFLALLNLFTLIIAASLWTNLTSAWPYAHSIHYHYVLPIVPFIFISSIIGFSRFKKRKIVAYSLLFILIISSLISNNYLAPYYASMKNHKIIADKLRNFNVLPENEEQIYYMMSLIPKNASVSASYTIVPHLTHRDKIYDFTNPFKAQYWGNFKEGYPPEYVDYLLLSKTQIIEQNLILQPLMENNTYKEIYESESFKLLKKQS